MVGPEAFTEVKYLRRTASCGALDDVAGPPPTFARRSAATRAVAATATGSRAPRWCVVAMGSALGHGSDVVDELRDEGVPSGCSAITCSGPGPHDEVRERLRRTPHVVVVERAVAVGSGSILGQDVRLSARRDPVHDVVRGSVAGRSRGEVSRAWSTTSAGRLRRDALHFLDLDWIVASRARPWTHASSHRGNGAER